MIYINYQIMNSWISQSGIVYKIGDVIVKDYYRGEDYFFMITGFTQNKIQLNVLNQIYYLELEEINVETPDITINGDDFMVSNFKSSYPKKDYQKVYPDRLYQSILNRIQFTDNINQDHNYVIPNHADRFECKFLNCCSEKVWKIYTRQE